MPLHQQPQHHINININMSKGKEKVEDVEEEEEMEDGEDEEQQDDDDGSVEEDDPDVYDDDDAWLDDSTTTAKPEKKYDSHIHPFIHSSIHPFIHSSIHPFIHSNIHSLSLHIYPLLYTTSQHKSTIPNINWTIRDEDLKQAENFFTGSGSKQATTRLIIDLNNFMKSDTSKFGCSAEPIGDNLYVWNVKVRERWRGDGGWREGR